MPPAVALAIITQLPLSSWASTGYASPSWTNDVHESVAWRARSPASFAIRSSCRLVTGLSVTA